MDKIIYTAITRYFTALATFGYKDDCSLDKLIVLMGIQDILYGDFSKLITVTPVEYEIFQEALTCLYGSSCIMPYPNYIASSSALNGGIPEIDRTPGNYSPPCIPGSSSGGGTSISEASDAEIVNAETTNSSTYISPRKIWKWWENILTLWNNFKINYLQFNLNPTLPTPLINGLTYWDNSNNCLNTVLDIDNGVILQNGQEVVVRVRNSTDSKLFNGTIVYITTANGNNILVDKAIASTESALATIGALTCDIDTNTSGWMTLIGKVNELNTQAFEEGDTLYLSTTAGEFTNIKPPEPNYVIELGRVTKKSSGSGTILIHIDKTIMEASTSSVRVPVPILNNYYVSPRRLHDFMYDDFGNIVQANEYINPALSGGNSNVVLYNIYCGFSALNSHNIFIGNANTKFYQCFGSRFIECEALYSYSSDNGVQATDCEIINSSNIIFPYFINNVRCYGVHKTGNALNLSINPWGSVLSSTGLKIMGKINDTTAYINYKTVVGGIVTDNNLLINL